jgi:hypothetical protein
MTLLQRIIIALGCNSLILLGLQPPVYLLHADGTRIEHHLEFFWHIPPEWSVNVPHLFARFAIIVFVTVGWFFVFRPNSKPETSK